MALAKLVRRNLLRHPLRTLLTVLSLLVGVFFLCTLRSLITSLEASTEASKTGRLVVQSAVSLYVDLPLSYQAKIAAVDGVARTCKWQWFGGYYQDPANQFGQFAVDPEALFEMYPEIGVIAGSEEAFLADRRGCVVGEGLCKQFGWKVGDTVPLIGSLYPNPEGPDVPWEFIVEAVYRPAKPNFDDRTMFFHWDYYEKTIEAGEGFPPGMGTVFLQLEDGADPNVVAAAVDRLFENGPQRVQTTSESEFQAQFVSMLGNVPFFLAAIGGAVLLAILLATVNTMLMAAREQTFEIGVLKSLGFTDARMFALLAAQSMAIALLGGLSGLALAVAAARPLRDTIAPFVPTPYTVTPATVLAGLVVTVLIGAVGGVVPALQASGLRPTEALASTE